MNLLRIRLHMLLLMIGFVLVFAGVQQIMAPPARSLSDEEIMERAKALGMVDLKEAIEKQENSKNSNPDASPQ